MSEITVQFQDSVLLGSNISARRSSSHCFAVQEGVAAGTIVLFYSIKRLLIVDFDLFFLNASSWVCFGFFQCCDLNKIFRLWERTWSTACSLATGPFVKLGSSTSAKRSLPRCCAAQERVAVGLSSRPHARQPRMPCWRPPPKFWLTCVVTLSTGSLLPAW